MSNDKKGCLVDVPREEQRFFLVENRIEKELVIAAANAQQAAETFWEMQLYNQPGDHYFKVSV